AFGLIAYGDLIDIHIPNRTINAMVSADVLARRRAAMDAKGAKAWKPVEDRPRKVSRALKVYAAHVGNAAQGAVRLDP
ncbi:dihydroxy-acid dehydratase, partial [Tepidimonas sp.]|uniref:dihydroxy-acid dehydratase domain-containing protein n=1 Tax=Tepidimonas sp. TaxID=2002775 RepID=UPI00391C8232